MGHRKGGRWRKHRGRKHSGRWRQHWLFVRGVHRRVIAFLFFAVALGIAGGWATHHVPVPIVLGVLLLALWPLGWIATWRIARPMRDLAEVASELRDGQLKSRDRLGTIARGGAEVDEVADALGGMADRVAQQLADQRALMAAVSHELRSPLARVRVMVELAREGQAGPNHHDELQAEVDGMDALVGDLLAAARIDFEAVSPVELDAREVALRALSEAGLGAELLDGDSAPVQADATLLARALGVLLDNAERYGGGVVGLAVTADDDVVRFSVLDGGPGFQEGEAEQVFEPFWRRPPTADRPAQEGVGLGLALVRQIAQAHGGQAGAANRPGGGAEVWLELRG